MPKEAKFLKEIGTLEEKRNENMMWRTDCADGIVAIGTRAGQQEIQNQHRRYNDGKKRFGGIRCKTGRILLPRKEDHEFYMSAEGRNR